MEELRGSFKKLIMEDPRLTKHSRQYSSNKEDIETEKNLTTEELEKNQDFSQQTENKIVNRHRVKYTATRIKYSPTKIKSRNFL